jgi:hypothetical protein
MLLSENYFLRIKNKTIFPYYYVLQGVYTGVLNVQYILKMVVNVMISWIFQKDRDPFRNSMVESTLNHEKTPILLKI